MNRSAGLCKSLLTLIILFINFCSQAQVTPVCATSYYTNGQFENYVVGNGAGGANTSAISPTGVNFGFGANNASNRVAEDFTVVGTSWTPTSITLYTYQTGSTTTSSITAVPYVALWTTAPAGAAAPAYSSTANTIVSNVWTNVYRVQSTTLTNAQRPIMAVTISWPAAFPPSLTAGTYWLEWGFSGSASFSGPWSPVASIGASGNSKQHTIAGDTWAQTLDGTNGVELPFVICQCTTPINNPTTPTPQASTTSICGSGSTNLSVASGSLNSATAWKWYTGSCGGTLVGTTTSNAQLLNVSPTQNTRYYVRAEGSCVPSSACGFIDIIVYTAAINYAGSPYCTSGTATVTQTGAAGGVYTAPAGVSINSATGDINLGASTPGTYTISYTIPAASGCPQYAATTSVTITSGGSASISYLGSPYCATGTASVTQTGLGGGTYSAAPSGLSLNASTGAIDLAASTPGTYTVSYNATPTGCAPVSATTSVTVSATGTVTQPTDVSACNGNTVPAVTFAGGSAGTVYNWTNTNTSIGLAASGTGNLPSFTATNAGSSPVTASVTVTPTASSNRYAYIANNGAGTVSVISTASGAVVGSPITAGTNPHGVAVSADGTRVYVTNSGGNSVSVINTSSNTVVATIPVAGNPHGITITPDGSKVYTANYTGNSVSVITTASNTVTATVPAIPNPEGIAVSPDGASVYVASSTSTGNIKVINISTNAVTNIAVGSFPHGLAVSSNGKIYVANNANNNVSVITGTSVTATIPVGTSPLGVAVSPDGSKVYVTNSSSNTVSVINASTNVVTATVNVGTYPYGVAVTPDGASVYVANKNSNNISIINASTNVVTATTSVGTNPVSLGNFISTLICSGTPKTFTITVGPTPTVTQPTNQTLCSGASTGAVTFAGNATTFNWTNSNTTIGLAASGTGNIASFTATNTGATAQVATITVTPVTGACSGTPQTFTITVNPKPSGTITNAGGTTVCPGAPVTLTVTGGTSYQWSLNGTPIGSATGASYSATQAGTYSVQITNSFGCSNAATNTITLAAVANPVVDFSYQGTCSGSVTSFTNLSTGNGTLNYVWDFGDGSATSTGANPTHTFNSAGTYNVKLTATSAVCPNATANVTKPIIIDTQVVAMRLPTMDVRYGTPTEIRGRNFPNAAYAWSPLGMINASNIYNPEVSASQEQLYLIRMTFGSGCVTTDTLLVRIQHEWDIAVPNVFSPNGDGQNDVLHPILVGIDRFRFFKVYNRLGQLMFETSDSHSGWDGTHKGKPAGPETYIWVTEGYDKLGGFIRRTGNVTLVR